MFTTEGKYDLLTPIDAIPQDLISEIEEFGMR